MRIGIGEFRVRINDRRMLLQLLLRFGFSEPQVPGVCIVFDKLDEIGVGGMERELSAGRFDPTACARLMEYVKSGDFSMPEYIRLARASEYTQNMKNILQTVNRLSDGLYRCEFDISLVRGQGYYTGAVFEIESLAYSGSLAGGGRYDNLIGRFLNEPVPAVGFSIGFERIFDLLLERKFEIPDNKKKVALLFEGEYSAAHRLACSLRKEYDVTILERPKKIGKLLDRLQNGGYFGYCIAEQSPDVEMFVQR